MDHEQQELRIAALLDAADVEQARVREAITELKAGGESLRREVRSAASEATREALKALQTQIDQAQCVVLDLQRLSLMRAAWQHVWVALVAIAITVLAVWWYVPSVSEMTALQAERDQLQASIEDLTQRGAKIVINNCGPKRRLCVAVDDSAGVYGEGREYRIAKGY
jgi:hypothetical protein